MKVSTQNQSHTLDLMVISKGADIFSAKNSPPLIISVCALGYCKSLQRYLGVMVTSPIVDAKSIGCSMILTANLVPLCLYELKQL